MILIIGLGNPGEKYAETRHNIGFLAVEELARKLLPLEKTKWEINQKFNSELIINNSELILAKPQTFMNSSGSAVAGLVSFYKIKPEDIWVVHDDADLALGHLRIRKGGGAAGHHGVESIIEKLGNDQFMRFRLGISRPVGETTADIERFVLQKFESHELSEIKHLLKKTVSALIAAVEKGVEAAANQYSN